MTIIQNEILKRIKVLSSFILEQYNALKTLEIDGNTECKEFKDLIEDLEKNLYLENSLYDDLGNNPNELAIILDEITMACLAWDLDVDFILLLENKKVDLVDRRIILKLCDRINRSRVINPLMPLIVGTPDVNNDSYKYSKLSVSVRCDFLNTILTLLNEQIHLETDEDVCQKLIQLKYNLCYFYDHIEADLINNSFRVNPQLVWSSPTTAIINQIDESMVKSYQVHYAAGIVERPIERLEEIPKKHLNNKDVYFQSLVYQILIRCCLLFGEDAMVLKLKQIIKKNYFRKNAVSMIKEALEMYENDKTKPWIISLNL